MTGETIKKVLADNKRQMKDIAELLGTSLSNLSAGLSKSDIKTGLLEKISEASGIPIYAFYDDKYGAPEAEAPETDASVLDLLKAKEEQLTLAMKQTSVAQEHTTEALAQMREVIKALKAPAQTVAVPVLHTTQPVSSPVKASADYVSVGRKARRSSMIVSKAKKLTDKPKIG